MVSMVLMTAAFSGAVSVFCPVLGFCFFLVFLPSTPVVLTLVAFWWCRCRVAAHRFDHADTWLRQAGINVVRVHVAVSPMTGL